MIEKFTIKFCGAATEVTGSMHLLLDAGAYQGPDSKKKKIKLKLFEKPISLLYSGDLGGANFSLHLEPKPPKSCDYLIIESTYGNRTLAKTQQDILEKLK